MNDISKGDQKMYCKNISESEYIDLILKRIGNYMDENKIKQSALAKLSKINQSTLSKLMNREVKLTIQHIFKICQALKINPATLMAFDDIIPENFQKVDSGLVNKEYLNDHILIRNTAHPVFKGYIKNEFNIYFYSTISSESSLLEGKIHFDDTEYHNFCKASMTLYTGQTDPSGEKIKKNYHGELIISLTMGTCYCLLIEPDIGEVCSINFKHTFLFNQRLICRVATMISTSSGTNKLPIMQRALIVDRKLNVNDPDSPDFTFVRGQLKLNESEMIIPDDVFDKLVRNESYPEELQDFLRSCGDEVCSSRIKKHMIY